MALFRRTELLALAGALALGAAFGACSTSSNPCHRVSCEPPRVCNPAFGTCELPAGYDAGLSDAGVDCGPACGAGEVCDRALGRCVQCRVDADCRCPDPLCVEGRCTPDTRVTQAVTPRDTCSAAPSYIACGPKTFTVEADLTAAASSVSASCGVRDGGAGALLFNVVLGTRSNLRVAVAAGAPGSQPVVAVRERCGADVDLACRSSQGVNATFGLRQLAEGAYTVVLQGYDRAGAGPARATIAVEPPSGSRNETCALAAALPLDGGAVPAALGGADDDVALVCNTAGGPDLFYRFTLTESSDVTIDSTSDEPLRAVLALWTTCELSGAPLGCTTASSTTGRLLRRRLAAGSYVLGLENAGPAPTGAVTLRLTAEPARPPPSNDTCALPADLVFTANETRTLADASRANDDGAATCGGGGGPDLVYRLNVPIEATYTFTATPEPGSGAAPVLYLRKASCDATGAVQDCRAATAAGQPAAFGVRLSPDTYYLWVDAASPETAGPVTVTVSR